MNTACAHGTHPATARARHAGAAALFLLALALACAVAPGAAFGSEGVPDGEVRGDATEAGQPVAPKVLDGPEGSGTEDAGEAAVPGMGDPGEGDGATGAVQPDVPEASDDLAQAADDEVAAASALDAGAQDEDTADADVQAEAAQSGDEPEAGQDEAAQDAQGGKQDTDLPAVRPSAQQAARMAGAASQLAKGTKRVANTQIAKAYGRPATVAAGEYLLLRADTNTMVVEVAASSKKAGAATQLAASANNGAQKWKLALNWLGYYTLANAGSGKMLDYAGMPGAGKAVVQAGAEQSGSQYWVLQKSGLGYVLRSAIDRSYALECNANGKAGGTKIVLRKASAKPAQVFRAIDTHPKVEGSKTVAAGVYLLQPLCGNATYVGVKGAGQDSGANVQTASSAANTAQRWVLSVDSDGFYQLANVSSGHMLDVAGGNYVPTTNVWQATANGTDAQKWAIRDNGDGTYSLISKKNALALDVANAGSAAGTNLQVYWPHSGNAQKFKLTKIDLLAGGIYSFYSKTAPTTRALDVKGGSAAQNAALQACVANATFSQKFKVVRVAANTYTLQAAVSGKYVTDSGSGIVQRSAASGTAADSQLWVASWAQGGVVLTNKATGKVMSTGTTPAANGTALKRFDAAKGKADAFRPANVNLLDRGLYQLRTLAGNAQLASQGGSLAGGANLVVGTPSGANAQKFVLAPAKDGYFQIMLALAGTTATVENGSGNNHANVRLYAYTTTASQMWKPEITDAGVVFVNRNSGKVLEAASATNGGNVRQASRTGKANQSWAISKTTINVGELGSLLAVVTSAQGGSGTKTTAGMNGYRLSSSASSKLSNALAKAWNRGYSVGFAVSDVSTGATLSLNADKTYYGASTMKAAYVTYIFQELLEKDLLFKVKG